MDNFPTELLKLIISFLPDDGLDEYMKVCKSWYTIASEKKYKKIKAYPVSSSQYIQNLLSTRIDGSKAINYVKLCYFGDWRFFEDDFQQLMSCLPNLKMLANIPPECLSFLNNDDVLGRLSCLEAIVLVDLFYSEQSADLYFKINVKLKNQITYLTLAPVHMVEWKNNCEELIATLSTFRILKTLRIFGCYEKCTETINLSSILSACSSLVSLNIYNTYTWKIDTAHSIVYTSLKSLVLTVGYLTEDHLKYMIRHLPNLKSFTLSITRNTFESVLALANPSIVKEAAIFLKKMKHLVITQTALYGEAGVGQSRELLVFWDFLRILCDQDCYCDLEAYVSPQAALSTTVQLKKQDRNLFLKCSVLLDSSNYANWVQILDFLTFRTLNLTYSFLHITSDGLHLANPVDDSWISGILVKLLKHQQHKHMISWINIRHNMEQIVKFS